MNSVTREPITTALPESLPSPQFRWEGIEAMERAVPSIELANLGASIDHLTAASNTAALIETVAGSPGARILNSADPDTPTAGQIVRAIVDRIDWRGRIELVDVAQDPDRKHHPGEQRTQSSSTRPLGGSSATHQSAPALSFLPRKSTGSALDYERRRRQVIPFLHDPNCAYPVKFPAVIDSYP